MREPRNCIIKRARTATGHGVRTLLAFYILNGKAACFCRSRRPRPNYGSSHPLQLCELELPPFRRRKIGGIHQLRRFTGDIYV